MLIGSVSAGVLVEACKPDEKKAIVENPGSTVSAINRMKEEEEHYKEVISQTFFTPEEIATIGILADIIIPRDSIS